MTMKLLLLMLVVVNCLPITGCFRNCKDAKYQFSMVDSFAPETDSLRIGDTLWARSTHSTTFTDLLTNAQVNFSNSNIGVNLRILNLPDTSQQVAGGISDFDILTIDGNEVGNDNIPSQNKNFYFEEKKNSYLLKLALVPKKKGTYCISFSNSVGVVHRKKGCEKAGIEIDNSNTNNHLYLYQTFFHGLPLDEYTKTHVYCFKVY